MNPVAIAMLSPLLKIGWWYHQKNRNAMEHLVFDISNATQLANKLKPTKGNAVSLVGSFTTHLGFSPLSLFN